MEYKGYTETVTKEVSEDGTVISMSKNIEVNWKEMNNNVNTQQQQQQQSSREDSPGIA